MAKVQKNESSKREPIISSEKAPDESACKRDGKQSIEELTLRYNQLNTRKIQAEAHLENAERELARLKEKAQKEYGTDNVQELRTKLSEMEEENERKRSEYQRNLDEIEAKLAVVDRQYAEVKDGNETKVD